VLAPGGWVGGGSLKGSLDGNLPPRLSNPDPV